MLTDHILIQNDKHVGNTMTKQKSKTNSNHSNQTQKLKMNNTDLIKRRR